MKQFFTTGISLLILTFSTALFAQGLTPEQITAEWKAGNTLPTSVFDTYQLPTQRRAQNDTGINVLVDLNRINSFNWMWNYPPQFTQNGFRSCATQATLDTILSENPRARVRVAIPNTRPSEEPFAWWTPPEFNVVVIPAGNPTHQQFLQEEIEVLKKFVNEGGGVIILAVRPANDEVANTWSFNKLLGTFDAMVQSTRVQTETGTHAALKLSDDWEPLVTGDQGGVVRARRTFGKGRVMILENDAVLCYPSGGGNAGRNNEITQNTLQRQQEFVTWVAGGKPPVGGDHTLPQPRAGGGGIYPDQEVRTEGIVAYYAKNQIPELLQVVKDDMPIATEWIYSRLPSVKPEEPMMFVLTSSTGGGWAVNVRLPKEVGIISNDRHGIVGIFAHEQAHTMRGPTNEKGGYGASPAHDLSGEAHAGWFQGKVWAEFFERDRERSNRNCNSILSDMEKFLVYDFSKQYNDNFGWTKLWWVWQKLDDRYGPTWYPRWYWIRATRWQDHEGRRQTWDETIEDMSIAVGEDLFPFFKKIGTTLDKERFAEVEFQGEKLTLPIADIDLGPGGNVNLSPIGDHTKPLVKVGE